MSGLTQNGRVAKGKTFRENGYKLAAEEAIAGLKVSENWWFKKKNMLSNGSKNTRKQQTLVNNIEVLVGGNNVAVNYSVKNND